MPDALHLVLYLVLGGVLGALGGLFGIARCVGCVLRGAPPRGAGSGSVPSVE